MVSQRWLGLASAVQGPAVLTKMPNPSDSSPIAVEGAGEPTVHAAGLPMCRPLPRCKPTLLATHKVYRRVDVLYARMKR